jgi:hypothetical protein
MLRTDKKKGKREMNKILELHAEWLKKQGLVQKAKECLEQSKNYTPSSWPRIKR